METWSAHLLYSTAEQSLGPEAAADLRDYASTLINKDLPVLLSLRHLSKVTRARYITLHETVNRKREASNYRMYAIKKRSGGRRFIHAVSPELFKVQTFINQEILQRCQPHPCSMAFHKSGGIRKCAAAHCGARWLFQFDLSDFFYDVSEIDCYHVFASLGYRRLLSFELARLCTTTRLPRYCPRALYHGTRPFWYYDPDTWEHVRFDPNMSRPFPYIERFGRLGALPQGAPTSPMLSNLAAAELDALIGEFARTNNLIYTRYADDITLSATQLTCSKARIRAKVLNFIRRAGFRENPKKTRIAGPGSRKLVLGLLVDGSQPRLSKATYKRIDRLLYGTEKHGFESAASYYNFDSAYGFHNHLSGLVAFVKSVDQERYEQFSRRMDAIKRKWGTLSES